MFKRNSRQRDLILKELKMTKTHPTAAILYEAVRKRIPNISLGTVYRNLDLLTKMGIIRKLEIGGSEARFDASLDQHYHIVCTECGRIDDVHDLPLEDRGLETIKEINGYQVNGFNMNFMGICSNCQKD
jgi:Fe2+ or Zn2+ uptake regulation protein